MEKGHRIFVHILLVVYIIVYFISAIFQSDLFGDILSPIGTLISFFILIYVYKKSERSRNVWFILSLASLIWALSDIAWGVCELLLGINPENISLFNFLYLGTNIGILVAAVIYMKKFVKGINLVQLIIDVFAITISCFVIFWFLFLHRSLSIFIENIDNITEFIYIITDFLIINCIVVGLFSLRRGRLIKGIYITILGSAMYAIVDLIYVYQYFYNSYVPNSITDFMYAMSLMIISFGGLNVLKYNTSEWADKFYSEVKNVGSTKKGLVLLFTIPISIIFGDFNFEKIVMLIFIYVVYEVLSNYVQKAINNEKLFTDEKNMNLILEEKIEERTKELLQKNEQLEYISNHDFVTNIYNRRYLNEYLDYIINDKKTNQQITIFYIDVDRFKTINDIYGHDIGDYILIEISKRLEEGIHKKGILARLGGDEFVIALEGEISRPDIEKISKDISSTCNKSVYVDSYEFNMTLSIGISVFPDDALSRNVLLKNADIAMYDAKSKGKNTYSFFNSYMSNAIVEKNEIEILLKNANYNKEFELYYQPQVDIKQNKLIGMEALIRWNSPVKGNIPPNKFIRIAEEIGCIEQISDWVMNTAARQIGIWNKKFGMELKMSINISPNQLSSVKFASKINKIITKYGLQPSWIDIEITENIAMKGEIVLEEIFSMLNNMGVSISIDDFGTGYSSLSYIQQFSFERLKIAKELIDNITDDLNKRYIVKAIEMLSEGLNILTIAEGVETKEQLKIIKELGCDQVQGYVFSRPITAYMFEEKFLSAKNNGFS
ncbi:GGDEF and EAL domain-containing protein [Clostridium felsineum]|uniref:Uncharacterized protein n=1 Tax=Clostridium felsineum TaxID=36839 RepID=A0A1S8L235_9CLOT|nr:GGDEF and EAL domain-containing protein [Clostridium felsineum]URZ05360.1 hypothetical protein CLROS_006840 [Clostridium felsineum]URZ10401.1 hypothetical protein CROST_011090 [Clostridium felsineum]